MRLGALVVASIFALTGAMAGVASAEKVKTNQKTKLYAHPGEQGKVLLTVKTGQAMTVLTKEGRWLKVRVNGMTGYVPRSKVDLPDDDEIQRNTRRRPFVDGRSTQRGGGGEGPDDRVGADAVGDGDDGGKGGDDGAGDDDGGKKPKPKAKPTAKPKAGGDDDGGDDDGGGKKPKPKAKPTAKPKPKDGDDDGGGDDVTVSDGDGGSKDGGGEDDNDKRPRTHVEAAAKIYNDADKTSGTAFTAQPEQVLFVEDKKGKWTQVSVAEGDIGWVQTSKLDLESSSDEGGGAGIGERAIDLRARVGASFINQGLRTTGSAKLSPPDNYNIGTAAATLAIGADYLRPYKKDLIVGGELSYDYDKSYPGISFNMKTTSISIHQIDLRAVVGYDLHKSNGMVIWGHLGYRYQGYLVANVGDLTQNTASIPSEVFEAPTFGGAITVPRLTDKIGVRASLDLAVIGTSLTQTKNLDDGLSPSEKQVNFGLMAQYRWKPKMDLQATYDLTYGSASFGAVDPMSERQHMGTSVARTDIFHTIAVGVVRSF